MIFFSSKSGSVIARVANGMSSILYLLSFLKILDPFCSRSTSDVVFVNAIEISYLQSFALIELYQNCGSSMDCRPLHPNQR